jgi:hypothetical protein
MIGRRKFIAGLGGAAWPLVVSAQQRATPVIGFLHQQTAETTASLLSAFRGGLGSTGFVDGRNVAIEYPKRRHVRSLVKADAASPTRSISVGRSAALSEWGSQDRSPLVTARQEARGEPIAFLRPGRGSACA